MIGSTEEYLSNIHSTVKSINNCFIRGKSKVKITQPEGACIMFRGSCISHRWYYQSTKGQHGSSVGSALDSHSGSRGSNPADNVLFLQTLPASHPVWTYWEIKCVSMAGFPQSWKILEKNVVTESHGK